MNVKNCRKCRKLFNYVSGPQICPVCAEALEAKFQEVKEYVRANPAAASIHEIAKACDVEPQQINQWIREERLTFGDDSPMGVTCESCGAMIKTGRFCEKCKGDLAKGLISAAGLDKKAEPEVRKASREAARMRFLDGRK